MTNVYRLGMILVCLGLLAWVFSPLVFVVSVGAVLAVVAWPLQRKLLTIFPRHPAVAALLTSLGIVVLILVPIALLGALGVKALVDGFVVNRGWESLLTSTNWDRSPGVLRVIRGVARAFHTDVEPLLQTLRDALQSLALRLAGMLGLWVGHLPRVLFALGLTAVSLFFLLKDGKQLVAWVERRSPLSPAATQKFLRSSARLGQSVVLATVVVGLAQTILFSLGCLIAGIPQVFLIGGLVFVASFVPVLGTLPVIAPIVLTQFLTGSTGTGIWLAIVALGVSLIDNFVRPWVLKEGANLHPFLALLSVFGGLQTIGIAGVILGPLWVGMGLLLLDALSVEKSASSSV